MSKPSRPEHLIDNTNQHLWKNRFGNPADTLKKAEKLVTRSERLNYSKGIAYSNLNIAAGYFLQSKTDLALIYLSEAFAWFEKNKLENGYTCALLLKGNIYESFGDYEKTLPLWLEAYRSSVRTGDKESEGEACNQLGLIYSRLCNFTKALEFFRKGLHIREELNDELAAASSLNRIGMVLRQTKKYDEALEYYFRSLEIRKRNEQFSAIPWTLLGIASTYEELKKYADSLANYELGMTGGDKRCTAQCMMGAGRVYSLMGNWKLAEKRLEQALIMASELKSPALIAEAHYALAAHYELVDKPEKALKSYKQFLKSKEALNSSEVQSRLSNIEVAHAIEKSEQEKEIYRLRHVELKKAYDIIEEKNRDITASINYASRIQRAILPNPADVKGLASKLFIVYFPKDIVSGDFYWFTQAKKKLVLVAADCTGHGVPGALMSMLGMSFLEEIVKSREITESGQILNELRNEIQRALHQKGKSQEQKDGMDIALCIIDKQKNIIQYSGAYNNLYLVRKCELTEYPADRMPIGIFYKSDTGFTTTSITSFPGDMIYMFSDGYADQFGGPDSKKFKYSRLKELLVSVCEKPLKEQKKIIEKAFLEWCGAGPQTDDVLLMGYRL